MSEYLSRRHEDCLTRRRYRRTFGAQGKKIMVRHDCSPELSRAGLPDPEAGHRSAAVRAARSALASTELPRAGLDGENDGVRSKDSASPPFFSLSGPLTSPSHAQEGVAAGQPPSSGPSTPMVCSHCSTSAGQRPMGSLVGRSPNAWPPCAYKCISVGTPAFCSAT